MMQTEKTVSIAFRDVEEVSSVVFRQNGLDQAKTAGKRRRLFRVHV